MSKIINLGLILFLITLNVSGQVAIINDKDGYTNVRELPDIESNIIYKLHDFELFLYEIENSSKNSEWIKVFIPKNKYTLGCSSFNNMKGYVHKSRLKPLEELNKYKGKDFSFQYNLDTFNVDNKIIDYADSKWISKINGRPYFGTDGEVPKNEILSIDISIEGNSISVPKILYQDLFELSNNINVYNKDDMYFVQHWNSDGAGGYLLVWAIDKKSVQQRLILIP